MPHMPSAPNARLWRHHLARLVRAPPCISCPRITRSLCAAVLCGVHSSILLTCPILHPCCTFLLSSSQCSGHAAVPLMQSQAAPPRHRPSQPTPPLKIVVALTPARPATAAVLHIPQQARHQPTQPAKHLPCTAGLPHQPAECCSAGAHRTLLHQCCRRLVAQTVLTRGLATMCGAFTPRMPALRVLAAFSTSSLPWRIMEQNSS